MARIITQRLINPIIGAANSLWAASILSMPQNKSSGPDLIDRIKFVEVKSGTSKDSWTLVDDQINYQETYNPLKGHILLVIYYPALPVKNLKEKDIPTISSMITKREAYLIPYNWLERFETRQGKHHNYLYPNPLDFPEFDRTYQSSRDILHIAKEIPTRLFKK